MSGEKKVRHRGHSLIRALGLLVFALWVWPGPARGADGVPLPDNPLRGRLTFEDKGCSNCHTIAGGSSGYGPSLSGQHFSGSFLDLGAALWNHVPGMSVRFEAIGLAWPAISGDEAAELTGFLHFIDYLGQPGRAEAGKRIFASKGCARCHSIGGEGAGSAPDLAETRRFASPIFISQAIWNHGPSMLESMRSMGMAPPEFEENDLADLSAYIRQTAEPGPQERVVLSPGNPNRGQQVFGDKGCSRCHAVEGRGGGEGPDLADSDLHRSAVSIAGIMWNHALEMRTSMQQKGIGWPSFEAAELADLIAYLYFLSFADRPGDADAGREVFAQRSCGDCHTNDGAVHSGPDLLASETARSPALLVAAMWNHAPVMKEAIVSEGRPWPELTGDELRDLLAYLQREAGN